MDYYRLYFMDRFSGHIEHFHEFEAEDDSAATAIAEGLATGGAMELWSRHRKLRHWNSDSPKPISRGKSAA